MHSSTSPDSIQPARYSYYRLQCHPTTSSSQLISVWSRPPVYPSQLQTRRVSLMYSRLHFEAICHRALSHCPQKHPALLLHASLLLPTYSYNTFLLMRFLQYTKAIQLPLHHSIYFSATPDFFIQCQTSSLGPLSYAFYNTHTINQLWPSLYRPMYGVSANLLGRRWLSG